MASKPDHDTQEAYTRAAQAARLIFGLNIALCLFKLAVGWLGDSFALLADGINNLTDVGVSLALILGMRLARKPPDGHHAYGHGKIEQEVARFVAAIILITGGGIIVEGFNRLVDLHAPPSLLVLWVAGVSIGVKIYMYWYQNGVARRTGSDALAADALNHKADIAATACVLVGTLATRWGGRQWAPADDVAAILVGLLMVVAAGRVILRSSSELLDRMPPAAIVDRIRAIAASHPGISGVEKLLGRKMGIQYLIDIHLEVPGDMPVVDAHELGHRVKNQIMREMKEVKDIVVHLEPAEKCSGSLPTK